MPSCHEAVTALIAHFQRLRAAADTGEQRAIDLVIALIPGYFEWLRQQKRGAGDQREIFRAAIDGAAWVVAMTMANAYKPEALHRLSGIATGCFATELSQMLDTLEEIADGNLTDFPIHDA